MTDRELLELAAKAAGIDFHARIMQYSDGSEYFGWNPLTDDGDALRLAVKLELLHTYRMDQVADMVDFDATDQDSYAATRRAIVRAAAAIGKAMK